jgi:predicted negative regulator of RcsB-dependent stress response
MPDPATSPGSKQAAGNPAPSASGPSGGLLLSEESLHQFWLNNRSYITLLCALLSLVVLAKYGWEYYLSQQEIEVQQAYSAATSVDLLRKFAADHPNHVLAHIAELRLADQAYAAGRIAEARDEYGHVALFIKTGPLAARTQLGLGVSQIQSGETAEGEATLKRLADDKTIYEATRAEAVYQLASAAAAAGRYEDVEKYAAQLMQISPNSPWTERAFALETETAPTRPVNPQAIKIGK